MAGEKSSLRAMQVASLKRMLNLNDSNESSEKPLFKILVFDDLGRSVISSTLRVSDLREMGITLHKHIASSRYSIPDVPVIYFVEPTTKNLKAIADDLRNGLYTSASVNFLSSISRPSLEYFASEIATAGTSENVAQVFDQHLNFIVSEPDLFSLGLETSHVYRTLNSARTKDEDLGTLVDSVVNGLFGVVRTMGIMPIIRCPPNDAAEYVATKLHQKIRDFALNAKLESQQPASTPGTRPVVVIVDRNIDLLPMLSHSWTYRSLIQDVLEMKLNRITTREGAEKKAYDITPDDNFWTENAGHAFPQVAENIDAELVKYQGEAAAVKGNTMIGELQTGNESNVQHLKDAITLLPQLQQKKAILDKHMGILASLLEGIKQRRIDHFFQVEENNLAKQTKAQLLEILRDDTPGGDPMDKLRLFIVWVLSTEQDVSKADWSDFQEALVKAGVASMASLAYIQQLRTTLAITNISSGQAAPQQQSASQDLLSRFSSISNRLTERLKETSNFSTNIDSLIGSIKNLLPVNRDLTITKIVESIMEPSAASPSALAKTENYLYLDPRESQARPRPRADPGGPGLGGGGGGGGGKGLSGTGATFGQRRKGFSEAIVFVVGGGSLEEYGNLQDWVTRTEDRGKRRIVYGSTDMMSSADFVREELEPLGVEIQNDK